MSVDTKRAREIGNNAIRDWECTHKSTIIELADELDASEDRVKSLLHDVDNRWKNLLEAAEAQHLTLRRFQPNIHHCNLCVAIMECRKLVP